MARLTTLKESKFLIKIEDTPGVFVAPCGITTKGIDFTAESNDFNIPDCDDPDAPAWTERVVSALSAGVSGSGRLDMGSLTIWREWLFSGAEKNIRVILDAPLASGGGTYAMSAILTSLNIGAEEKGFATIEVSIASHGEVTWTDAAA